MESLVDDQTRERGCCAPFPVEKMAADRVEELIRSFKAMAHPVRLQMLDILSRYGGHVCVCDLEDQFSLAQPTISHHLRVLRQAGLVDCQQRGQWVYYMIRPQPVAYLRTYLDQLVARAGQNREGSS